MSADLLPSPELSQTLFPEIRVLKNTVGRGYQIGGHGIPLQYSCLEESKDKGAWWATSAAAAAKSLQSCPTLCDPIDGSPPGSTVPGILQARTLEWVAISFSNA